MFNLHILISFRRFNCLSPIYRYPEHVFLVHISNISLAPILIKKRKFGIELLTDSFSYYEINYNYQLIAESHQYMLMVILTSRKKGTSIRTFSQHLKSINASLI